MKTAESDAHIMAMHMYNSVILVNIFSQYIVLYPKRKMKYFKKNWSAQLQKEVATIAEKIVS